MSKPTYYEYFNLSNFEDDQDKIKRAYRSMALKWHPDRCPSKHKNILSHFENQMKQINEVYRILSKDKEAYDRHLRIKLGIISSTTKRPHVSIPMGNGHVYSTGFNFYESY